MKDSNLFKILKRLDAMVRDQSGNVQSREFFQYGIPNCKVVYNQEINEFIVERYNPDQELMFDNMDLAAIEVYDCLYDFKHSF